MTRAPNQAGFSLIEILVAFAIFVITTTGVFAAIAASAGGSLDAIPTGLFTARSAKDITVATTYLQAFHEFLATQGGNNFDPSDSGSFNEAGPDPFGFPKPSSAPYQLDWESLVIEFKTWTWSGSPPQYVEGACNPSVDSDCVVSVKSTLAWKLKGDLRPPLEMTRFLPQ